MALSATDFKIPEFELRLRVASYDNRRFILCMILAKLNCLGLFETFAGSSVIETRDQDNKIEAQCGFCRNLYAMFEVRTVCFSCNDHL